MTEPNERTADAAESSSRSMILRLWQRLPVAIRAVLSGLVVFELMQFGWFGAFLANTRYMPEVPWNVPVGLLYLWIVFSYFNGGGWPRSTSAARRIAMRARSPSRRQWLWSLLYCVLTLVFLAAIINVVYRFIVVPAPTPMDTSMLPWWSLYPSLLMLSINAGVAEEAGFRGYIQGGLERRYGPVTAIIATSIIFWLAHLNHPDGASRIVLLIGYGLALGALTWAVQSIWPAIVTHAFCDAVSFMTIASGFGPDWFMKRPAQFSETGVDATFVVFSVLLVVSILAGILVLARLRRLTPTD